MKKKFCFLFAILLFSAGRVWSQGPLDIPIIKLPSDSIDKPTSPVSSPIPLVTLDGTELTFDFSPATVSQIVIMDENNNCQMVYSESFMTSTQVVVDLEDEGIGKGCYLLWLYAFGEWWEGEFVIEEE